MDLRDIIIDKVEDIEMKNEKTNEILQTMNIMNIQDVKELTEEEMEEAILDELFDRWKKDVDPMDFYNLLTRFEYVFCIPNDRKDCVFKVAIKDLEWSNDYSCFYCYLPDKNVYTKHDKYWDICYECLEDLLN